jgi:hypothetical protein
MKPGARTTVRGLIMFVAGSALLLAPFVMGLRWLSYPHINVTIYNELPDGIRNVRLGSNSFERTAYELQEGEVAMTVIHDGETNMWLEFTDSAGRKRSAGPFSHESGNRGDLEYHISKSGVKITDGIYNFDHIPVLGTCETPRTAQMKVSGKKRGDRGSPDGHALQPGILRRLGDMNARRKRPKETPKGKAQPAGKSAANGGTFAGAKNGEQAAVRNRAGNPGKIGRTSRSHLMSRRPIPSGNTRLSSSLLTLKTSC